jgi:hypothetical protein
MIGKIFGNYHRSLSQKPLTQPSKKKPHFQACKQKISSHKENGIGVRPGFINKEKNEDENASQEELQYNGEQIVSYKIFPVRSLNKKINQPCGYGQDGQNQNQKRRGCKLCRDKSYNNG